MYNVFKIKSQISCFHNDTHDEVCNLWQEFDAIHRYIIKETSSGADDGKLFSRVLSWMKTFKV